MRGQYGSYGYGYGSEGGTLYAAKEAYRTIRTNLMFSLAKSGCRTILFSSSIQGEGKTTSSANVAFALAQSNKKVLLLDMDLRKPYLHRLVKKPCAPGMTNFLSGFNTLEEVLHQNLYPNLDVICAGTISPNPAEMIASEGVVKLLNEMKECYDFIILDTPPITLVSDALTLMQYTDGIVLVSRPRYTNKNDLKKAISQVEFVGGKILGVIANGVQEEKRGYGYKKYSSYSRSGDDDREEAPARPKRSAPRKEKESFEYEDE